MIFGSKKKKEAQKTQNKTTRSVADDEDYELVKFTGALNGKDPDLRKAARLVDVGLIPAKELVTDAMLRRAEAIRIDPKGPQSIVSFTIDGVAYSGGRLSKQESNAVVQMLKLLAGLSVQVRNKPQAGAVGAKLEKTKYELNLTVTPVESAERLTIHMRDLSAQLNTLNQLGGSEEFKLKVKSLLDDKGFLGIVGPPHSGTTTTAYAAMRAMDPYLNQMFTLGDMGSVDLENIPPFEEQDQSEDLSETLTRCFRKDADIIFYSNLKDAETAKTLLKFHEHGGIVSEFTARSAAEGLAQLIAWTKNPQLIADSVRGVISQKLVRRLCVDCKQVFRPNPQFLAKAGLPTDLKQLSRPVGNTEDAEPCDTCDDIGFRGRAAMFELVEMTDAMKKLVLTNPKPEEIKALARKEGMLSLQKDGLRLVAEGITSLDELQRVFRPAGKNVRRK